MRLKTAIAIVMVLLLLKVVAIVVRGPSPLIWDSNYYWELGQSVANGDWLLRGHEVAYRTPGYPWLVGAVQAAFPRPMLVLVCVQAVLWLGTVCITAQIARLISDDSRLFLWVLCGAVLMVSSAIYLSAILTETLFTFLVMLHLWCAARFVRGPDLASGMLVGLTLAMAMLTRPVAMLLWIPDVAFLGMDWWQDSRRHSGKRLELRPVLTGVATAVFVAIVTLSPWLMRNKEMFDKAMMTEFVGRNIWIVTFQDGSGAHLAFPQTVAAERLKDAMGSERWQALQSEQLWRETWTVSNALDASGIDDAEIDRLMKRVAFDAIAESPVVYGRQTIRRWVNFWRTRATELPVQAADLEIPPGSLEKQLPDGRHFAGQVVWGMQVPLIDTAVRYRASNSLAANTLLMLLTGIATMLLVVRPATRASGVWIALVLSYFCTVTAVLEIPGYRYRMIVEPVMLLAIVLAGSNLLKTRGEQNRSADTGPGSVPS
ncbi:ArnT family glycosyltransferase [Rhodopirellula sp. MGV]|uniref:ArnT family glycosyltransferase n=1 Tax=Rhodopirellula sp. MGV TaxID=2023130 RepID=UPI000B9671CE|nr:glycosyltransferase family 39 protein [Rhodopirellula sp. MGV]OYP30336.1 hypothetical protein CGZ80_22900 [Rhodopirellula sp. MGV]PNY34691.1 hypothetical protein C2E31_22245 [Rhodopirellula baltica]